MIGIFFLLLVMQHLHDWVNEYLVNIEHKLEIENNYGNVVSYVILRKGDADQIYLDPVKG